MTYTLINLKTVISINLVVAVYKNFDLYELR